MLYIWVKILDMKTEILKLQYCESVLKWFIGALRIVPLSYAIYLTEHEREPLHN